MAYVSSNLGSGEVIVGQKRLHGIIFLPALLTGIVAAALLGARPVDGGAAVGGHLLMIVAGFSFARALLDYVSTEYVVTSHRVVSKTGWISRRTTETMVNRIEGIHLRQTVPGRVLGYGTVLVTGTGEQRNVLRMISAPLEIMRIIQDQVSKRKVP